MDYSNSFNFTLTQVEGNRFTVEEKERKESDSIFFLCNFRLILMNKRKKKSLILITKHDIRILFTFRSSSFRENLVNHGGKRFTFISKFTSLYV